MLKPTIEQLTDLIFDGTAEMWANETIIPSDQEGYKYEFNYEGLYLYHFKDMEHMLRFFYGRTNEELEQAKAECLTMEYNVELSRERGEETFTPVAADPEEEEGGFIIMNDTDGVTATPDTYPTREAAEAVIPTLRDRYRAQGYYSTNKWERISPDEIRYRVVDLGTDEPIIQDGAAPYDGKPF